MGSKVNEVNKAGVWMCCGVMWMTMDDEVFKSLELVSSLGNRNRQRVLPEKGVRSCHGVRCVVVALSKVLFKGDDEVA